VCAEVPPVVLLRGETSFQVSASNRLLWSQPFHSWVVAVLCVAQWFTPTLDTSYFGEDLFGQMVKEELGMVSILFIVDASNDLSMLVDDWSLTFAVRAACADSAEADQERLGLRAIRHGQMQARQISHVPFALRS
jgi:hypothetical protein